MKIKLSVIVLVLFHSASLVLIAGCGSSNNGVSTQKAPVITWSTPASVPAGTALSATQLDATANLPGTFAYSPAAGTIESTPGNVTLNVTFTPSDTTDYTTATASVTLTVTASAKTTPVITWNTPAAVVVGTVLGATQLDATASVPGTFVYSPAAGTIESTAGNVTLNVTFTPTDTTDNTTATASVTLNVTAKTTPVITWNTPAAVVVGTALSATQLDATASVAGTFVYSPTASTVESTAGLVTLNVTFTPSDTADYTTATASVTLNVTAINKTTPVITWSTPASVSAGTALSATQLDATTSVAGTFVYSPSAGTVESTAGPVTLNVSFTPNDTTDYNSATASVTLNVTAVIKTTPAITWNTPASVPEGTPLSATQLDATASVAGTFVYTPAAGKVESAAGNSTLKVTFTPSDTIDYNTATASVTLTVTPITPTTPSYSWSNVRIVAGGYVPGLYFHPTQQNLMYARTDIGGAYRWGPNDTQWVPLLDWISPVNWWYGGPEAIGLDPTDPNRLYIAVGEYAAENWDSDGAMLVSDDQGATFTTVPLTFKNGSNDNGRNSGERIAVDPSTPATVYFGTRLAGLQISTNHGSSWSMVSGLGVTSTANGSGVVSVVPVTSGGSTKAVYVAVAGTGVGTDPVGFYVSTNPGSATSTFTAVTGQPSFTTATTPLAPLHAILGPNGNIYVLYADQPGPGSITTSELWEFTPGSNWTSGVWNQITLPANPTGNGNGDGFGALAVDPSHAGVLLLATIDQYYPGDTVYRSTNDGVTWTDISRLGGTHNAALSPYLASWGWDGLAADWNTDVANVPGGSGNWVGSIVIDPFNSNHTLYGTGATIWESTNLTDADSSQTVQWSVGADGLEEASLGMAIAPPSGNTLLLSGMGDIYGFAHTDLTKSPSQGMYQKPRYYPSDMDFEQNTPTTVVRATLGNTPYGTISTDGGLTWTGFAGSPTWTGTSSSGGGSIAIAPDGSSMVWTPLDTASAWYSTNKGVTWLAATGLPASSSASLTQVVSDRVTPGVYYGYNGGTLYISTNQGKTWTSAQTGLPTNCNSQTGCLVILPDWQGDLWLASGSGLYHNTSSSTTPALTAVSGVSSANYLGFGKSETGSGYLTLYLYGTVSSQNLYRSIDGGNSWTQINDATHQWGGGVDCVTGDMRTFGTVYVGTNGRGIIWGTSTQ